MGCFSFKCKGCDTGINSTSFEGEHCQLFLLRDGKVIQEMEGDYDSYGRVFIDGTQRADVQHSLRESHYWRDPFPDVPLEDYWQRSDGGPNNPANHGYWLRVCDLIHSNKNSNGIAAYHVKCYKGMPPRTRSEYDTNQGWGRLRKKYMR